MKHVDLFCVAVLLLISQLSFSQEMPIDFSDASDSFTVLGGGTFVTRVSPTDSNNTVGEFFRTASSGAQSHYIDLAKSIDLDVEKNITLSFYAFDPNSHTIGVKLGNGVNADVQVDVTTSSPTSWTELTFDFSLVGGIGKYDRLSIIIDNGSTIPGAFLIDDINDGTIPTDPNVIDVEYTDLAWSDEFNTSGKTPVNATNWHHQTIGPNGGRWYNNEEQIYTNSLNNSFIENGFLNIVAIKEDVTVTVNDFDLNYTSARLNSKFAFTYGRVDVRAKLPSGAGTWPAIWMLGKNVNEDGGFWDAGPGLTSDSVNWPACGEIDIMEHGLGTVNHTSSALHTPSSSGNTINTASQVISDVANNFHIYSMNWSPDQITFLVDGVVFYTYNPPAKNASTWPFFEDQYILLNIAMGGDPVVTIDPNFDESSMIIDYVRVYQNSTLSTQEINASQFRIFPNPASDAIKIASNETIDRLELYSILGNLVMSKSESTHTMDVSRLSTGIYLLNIYSGSKKVTKKVVIN